MTALRVRALRGMDGLGAGGGSGARSGEVRVLFDADLLTFPLPRNATYADLAERIGGLESRGEPRHIELLLRPRARAAQAQKSIALLN